jgi:ribokinase
VNGEGVLLFGGLTLDWVRDAGGVGGPTPGGNALYAAVGGWLAGADVSMVTVVGADYPDELLRRLDGAGVGTGLVRRVEGPSFRVLLDETAPERAISYLPGSGRNAELDPLPEQLPAGLRAAGAHVAAIPTGSQRRLVDALAGRVTVVTLDTVHIPGEIEPAVDELLAVARRCTAFVPSREELRRLWPGVDPVGGVRGMSAWAAPVNVVKLGALGSVGCEGGAGDRAVHRIPAYATRAVDTTGAGDAYCGALCAALARGEDLPAAMALATGAASLVVERVGCDGLLTGHGRREARRRAEQVLDQARRSGKRPSSGRTSRRTA